MLTWTIITLAHGALLHLYYGFDWVVSFTDSISYNLLFAVIAPGFWYIVNFAGKTRDMLSLVVMHVGAVTVTVTFWSSLAQYPLQLLFEGQENYIKFLNGAYISRVITGVMYYGIIVLVFYLIKYYQDMRERTQRETELQHLLKDSELRMLKSQINPHFIFNSLNSISALTVSKPLLAQEMVIKLSSFLRYSLGKDSAELNTLKEELDNVSLYLEIEKIRFGEKLAFEKEVKEQCLGVNIPNLILQPIIENAIKYGLYESMETVTIRLKCLAAEEGLRIEISNNFDPESIAPKGSGIGLKNVKKRLQLVYGRADLLEVSRTDHEFVVTMKIPIN